MGQKEDEEVQKIKDNQGKEPASNPFIFLVTLSQPSQPLNLVHETKFVSRTKKPNTKK